MTEESSMYNKELSGLISDARELLGRLKNQNEINEAQIKNYKEVINEQRDILDKRMSLVEGSMKVFRNVLIIILTVVVIPFIIGGFTVQSDVNHIKNELRRTDDATKTEVLMSFGIIIDQNTDAMESLGMDSDEADRVNDRMKEGISRAFGYKSRSVKQ